MLKSQKTLTWSFSVTYSGWLMSVPFLVDFKFTVPAWATIAVGRETLSMSALVFFRYRHSTSVNDVGNIFHPHQFALVRIHLSLDVISDKRLIFKDWSWVFQSRVSIPWILCINSFRVPPQIVHKTAIDFSFFFSDLFLCYLFSILPFTGVWDFATFFRSVSSLFIR